MTLTPGGQRVKDNIAAWAAGRGQPLDPYMADGYYNQAAVMADLIAVMRARGWPAAQDNMGGPGYGCPAIAVRAAVRGDWLSIGPDSLADDDGMACLWQVDAPSGGYDLPPVWAMPGYVADAGLAAMAAWLAPIVAAYMAGPYGGPMGYAPGNV